MPLKASLVLALLLFSGCRTTKSLQNAQRTANHEKVEGGAYCWHEVGLGVRSNDTSTVTDIALATQGGSATVAWTEGSSYHHIRLAGTEDQATRVSGPIRAEIEVFSPILAASKDNLFLGWEASEGASSALFVGRWAGTHWELLGTPLRAGKDPMVAVNDATMVLDSAGRPFVAWQEANQLGPRSLYVAHWNGSAWESVGQPLEERVDSYSLQPSIALDRSDVPWVAWLSRSKGLNVVKVARWTGKLWVRAGGDLHGQASTRKPTLVMDGSGLPTLVALQVHDAHRISLSHWDGTAWQPVTANLTNGSHESFAISAAALSDGKIVVAWVETDESHLSKVYAKSLQAGQWSWAVRGLHLGHGPTDAGGVRVAASSNNGFFLAWDEPEARIDQRIRLVSARPCEPGEKPQAMAPTPSAETYWPKTVDEAVEQLMKDLSPKLKQTVRSTPRDGLIDFHPVLGACIRNTFGMGRGNEKLLQSCGKGKRIHPDECSTLIIEALWVRLQTANGEGNGQVQK